MARHHTTAASTAIRKVLHANARTGRAPKYLLSGLLVCGECGANLIMNGTGNNQSYCCSTRINGGTHACANSIRIPRRVAESKLLAGIKHELASPEFADAFTRSERKLLASKKADAKGAGKRRRDRLAELEQEIRRLVDAIASGLLSPAVKSRLQAAEAERDTLTRQESQPAQVTAKVIELLPRMADSYHQLVSKLETAVLADVVAARRSLKRLVGTVRVERAEKTGEPVGVVEMKTARFLDETGPLVSMVAGACFARTLAPVKLVRSSRKLSGDPLLVQLGASQIPADIAGVQIQS